MPRTPFAIMLAMTSFLALPVPSAWAQDSATDATTPIDRKVGNDMPPTDNTLSNDEVRQLKHQENTGGSEQGPGATITTGDAAPSVSGTTPSYKVKSGSAAKSEGGDVTGQ
jgi:hypothetical protein